MLKTLYSNDELSTYQLDCLQTGTKHDQTPATTSDPANPPNTMSVYQQIFFFFELMMIILYVDLTSNMYQAH